MPKERRGSQRDAWTPQGTQAGFDKVFRTVKVPRFIAKARRPHYLMVRKKRGGRR